jgi:hypothetical protein
MPAATPRPHSSESALSPRQFGYPLSFRGQVCGVHAPSRVSRQWLSPRDASLPSFGSRRARFPALSGTMKALRLPTGIRARLFGFASAAHGYLLVRVRRSAPGRTEVLFQARALGQPVPIGPARHTWTQMGSLRSSGDPSCAFAPLRDPGRVDVPSPLSVTSVLPPLGRRRRLRQWLISGLTRSFGTRCPTLHAWRCRTRARLASGWLAGLCRVGGRTHWIATKGFSSLSRSSSSPAILTLPTCFFSRRRRRNLPENRSGFSGYQGARDLSQLPLLDSGTIDASRQ